MTFSEKIKSARAAKNMSQKQLAEATGISERTIQNYELGSSMPKSKSTYDKLADALGINPQTLLDENAEFVLQAGERYGSRGRKQAEDIIRNFRVAAAGGELDDDDLDFIKEAMLQTYEDAKAYNRRFVNKRYQSGGDDD